MASKRNITETLSRAGMRFVREDSGLEVVEYALLVALLLLGAVVSAISLQVAAGTGRFNGISALIRGS